MSHDITIWKLTIFAKVDYIEIEPALIQTHWDFDYTFTSILKNKSSALP